MNLSILSDTIPWFGKFSGYSTLSNYFPPNINCEIFTATQKFTPTQLIKRKIIGKYFQKTNNWNFKNPAEIYTEIEFAKSANKKDVAHLLHLEGHIHILEKFSSVCSKMVGTIHIPFEKWTGQQLEQLSKVGHAIVFYNEEKENFEKYITADKLSMIRHGVDIDFFKPSNTPIVNKNKIVFIGHYLRNFDMLDKVYQRIIKDINSEIELHFIIPPMFRNIPVLTKLAGQKNVFFHANLSDEALLEFYHTSYLLLMPMDESGANTAIIQAIAVGLPIITTDIGGIRSYGGGEIYDVVKNNDCDSMVALFNKYYSNEDFRNGVSIKLRNFAVEEMDWIKVAKQHVEVYKKMINS